MAGGAHVSGVHLAVHLVQPTRGHRSGQPAPYSALLQTGFTMPFSLRRKRWALTPPFHPYPTKGRAVCFLWHCPSARAGRVLPGVLPCGARTFLRGNTPCEHLPHWGYMLPLFTFPFSTFILCNFQHFIPKLFKFVIIPSLPSKYMDNDRSHVN